MNSQQAVRQQLGFWHGVLAGMMSDCGDSLNKAVPGATINSIAAVYTHIIWAEDGIVNGMLQGKPQIYISDGWQEKLGIEFPSNGAAIADWAKTLNLDYAKFKEYADVVFANTDSYLANITDTELQEKTQSPIGEQTREWIVVTLLGTHAPQHTGEIAALKGVHGLKGLPF